MHDPPVPAQLDDYPALAEGYSGRTPTSDGDRRHFSSPANPKPRLINLVANARIISQRYYIWKDAQTKAHSAVWTDPRGYYFLNIMVVLPKCQGQGIGKRLVEAVTDQADSEGMPCYLEASRDVPNIQIYERMGFKFATKLDCDDEGEKCTLYCMVREPRSS